VETLSAEFDVMAIATAAIHLIQEASDREGAGRGATDAPSPAAFQERKPRIAHETHKPTAPAPRVPSRDPIAAAPREAKEGYREAPRPARVEPRPKSPKRRDRGSEAFTRIYVSAGRVAGVRPGDLVGAITGEASTSGDAIGTIELSDRFALVEVRESEADAIVAAINGATIRGRRVTASRYREPRAKK
jgi:ATP-dependent RNA helicase DeaD